MRIDSSLIINTIKESIRETKSASPLLKGEIIEGKILDANRSLVTILLENGDKLKATVKGESNYYIGESVKFAVKSVGPARITLESLVSESLDDKLINVLKDTNFTPTKRNITVLKEIFHAKMPLNKETVTDIVRTAIKHEELPPKMVVLMKKLDIPFTKENTSLANELIKGLKPVFTQTETLAKSVEDGFMPKQENNEQIIEVSKDMKMDKAYHKDIIVDNKNIIKSEIPSNSTKSSKSKAPLAKPMEELEIMLKLTGKDEEIKGETIEKVKLSELFTKPVVKEAFQHIEKPFLKDPEQLITLRKVIFSISKNDTLESVVEKLSMIGVKKDDVISAFKDAYAKKEVVTNFFLKDLKTMDKKEVKQFLKNNVKLISKIVSSPLKAEVKEKAIKLGETLKFVDKLNNEYSFIHIPLHVRERKINSEIYMYKNKSGKKRTKKSLKALLRLDLLNMGHLDIMINKDSNNIGLTFYGEDDLSDVKENINSLKDDLSINGYNLVVCDYQKNEEDSILYNFFDESEEENKNFRFDMRA